MSALPAFPDVAPLRDGLRLLVRDGRRNAAGARKSSDTLAEALAVARQAIDPGLLETIEARAKIVLLRIGEFEAALGKLDGAAGPAIAALEKIPALADAFRRAAERMDADVRTLTAGFPDLVAEIRAAAERNRAPAGGST